MSAVERTGLPPQISDEQLVNTVVEAARACGVERYYTIPGRDPFSEIEWEVRDAHIPGKDGPAFEQRASSSPSSGLRPPPTSWPRSTSAAAWTLPSASAPSSTWSTAWPTRSPAGAGRAATSPTRPRPTRSRPSSRRSSSTSLPRSTLRSGSTSASRRSRSARPASSSRSKTRWSRSSTGSAVRGSSSAADRGRASTSRGCAPRRSSSPRAGMRPAP